MALAAKTFADIVTFTRASTATYRDSAGLLQTAASGSARVADYNPAVLSQQNILKYSQDYTQAVWTPSAAIVQKNLMLWSQDISNAVYTKGNLNTTGTPAYLDVATAPDGTSTMDAVIENNTGTVYHFLNQNVTKAAAATNYTFSVYLKNNGRQVILNLQDATSTNGVTARFNLATGTVVVSAAAFGTGWTPVSARIVATENDTYRASITAVSDATTTIQTQVALHNGTTATYLGDGTSGVYVWGQQLIEGRHLESNYRGTTTTQLPCLYTAPDGTLSAMRLNETFSTNTHHIVQTPAIVKNGLYAFSIYVKTGGRNFCRLVNNAYGSDFVSGYFDVVNGTAYTPTVLGTASGAVSAIESADNGWFRVTLAGYASTVDTTNMDFNVRIASGSTTDNYAGDGALGMYIWGAQLNTGAAALPYLATTTVGGFATTMGALRGFRVESQTTNLILYSEDLRNTAEAGATRPWVEYVDTDSEVALVTTTNFKGVSASVSKLRCTTVGIVQRQTAQGWAGAADNTVYCVSCYAKAAEVSFLRLNFTTKALTYPNVTFDIGTGSIFNISSASGALVSYGIEPMGNGWWRCWVAANSLTGATNPAVTVQLMGSNGANYGGAIGDGMLLDGFQAEVGVYPTSYVQTTTAQVTRATDMANVASISPWYNQAAGTVVVEALRNSLPAPAPSSPGSYGRLFTVSDGTLNNAFSTGTVASQNNIYTAVTAAGAETMDYAARPMSAGVATKVALAITATSARLAVAGALAGASDDTSVTMPAATLLTVGHRSDGSQNTAWNGWIRSLKYYPRRVTNTELVSLTT